MASVTVAGRYRLEDLLNAGPMAEVWVATDCVLDRRVAVKLLAPNADRARFEREAQAAAGLAHPNIVQLFDYGEEQGRPYMVLEYLPGATLDRRLEAHEALPDDDVARIAADVAAGLECAHRNGIVHRDLKPANIFFDAEGRAQIGDLGIADVGGAATLTEPGTVLGTASYISPEQAGGHAATPASDVYSFGVTLYQMLTGRLPHEGGNAIEIAASKQAVDPQPVRALRPDAPEDLARLAASALARDPAKRPADGTALLAELNGINPPRAPSTGAATAVLPPRRARRPARRATSVAAGVAAVMAAGVGLLLAILVTGGHGSSGPSLTAPAAGTRSTQAARTGTSRSSAGPSTARAQTTSQVTARRASTPHVISSTPTASFTDTGALTDTSPPTSTNVSTPTSTTGIVTVP